MRFVTLKDGSRIRADIITAIRIGDARPADAYSQELKPRVIVDFGQPQNCVVLDCETNAERDALADQIEADMDNALRGKS